VVGAVTWRSMTVAPSIVARQQTIEGRKGVVIGARAELEDHEPGRRVRHEDGQQPIPSPGLLGDEAPAGAGQVGEAPLAPGPNLDPDGLHPVSVADGAGTVEPGYGKIERSASRIRPSPPLAGADS